MAVEQYLQFLQRLGLVGLFSSWRGGGLCHSQFLSQVIESSDVVHTALTHHTGELRVHFCSVRKATRLKGVVGVAVQEAGAK